MMKQRTSCKIALWALCLILPLGLLLPKPSPAQTSGTFTNPIDPDGADPFLTYVHGSFYLLCTDGPNDAFDTDGPHHMTVRASKSLRGLTAAQAKTVYTLINAPTLRRAGRSALSGAAFLPRESTGLLSEPTAPFLSVSSPKKRHDDKTVRTNRLGTSPSVYAGVVDIAMTVLVSTQVETQPQAHSIGIYSHDPSGLRNIS